MPVGGYPRWHRTAVAPDTRVPASNLKSKIQNPRLANRAVNRLRGFIRRQRGLADSPLRRQPKNPLHPDTSAARSTASNPKSKIQNPKFPICLVVSFAVSAAYSAFAQTLVVETATMTAAREAVRVYVQEISLDTGAPTPLATQLPGASPASPLFVTGEGIVVAATSQSNRRGADAIAGWSPLHVALGDDSWRAIARDGAILAGTIAGVSASGARAVVVSALRDGPLSGHGRIDAWTIASTPVVALAEPPATWLLPGTPHAAVTHPIAGWVAALCRMPNGATVLHVRDAARGRVIQERLPLAQPNERLAPAALMLAEDGATLIAVLNDINAAPESDEGRCWAAALDARSFAPIGARVELRGTIDTPGAVVFGGGGTCWVATRSPSAGFAFAYGLDRTADQFEIADQRSFTGLSRALVLAAAEDRVAIGVDRRVEILPAGSEGAEPLEFRTPITAMCWTDDALIVAEANRVHAIATDHRRLWTTSLQTGHVLALSALDAPYAQERFTDMDGDRIADAIDPEPTVPSPRLDVPREIVLREDTAGAEVRAVRIASDFAERSVWRATIDANAAPWLRVFPRQGRSPGWFIAGADPSQLHRANGAHAFIDISMTGTIVGTEAFGSPRRIGVRIEPVSASARSVLWLLGGGEPGPRNARDSYGLGAVAAALSGPPFYWSHDDTNGEPLDSIADYAVVVLDSAAIGAGLVSRQSLLDYVARGGGLLVIARANDGASGAAQRWLAPAGIAFEPGTVSGAATAVHPHAVTRHWISFAVDDAARMKLDAAMAVLAAAGDSPVLAVRQFGRGRMAVLASPAPLHSDVMASSANRLFACDLFDWLSRSAIETKDLDADGLPDELEDRNDNGVMDEGETSKFDPDSDGDGIPDGKEDANANGIVDDGETDPLNADTDGDGDWDGADYDPYPATRPQAGEPDAAGDAMNEGPRAALQNAPLNDAPGRPGLRLEANPIPEAQYEAYVMLSIAAPGDADLGRILLRLDTEPAGNLEWFDLRASPDAELAGRRAIQRETKEWGIAIEITPPSRPDVPNALIGVKCRHRFPLSEPRTATVVTKEVSVTSMNGEPIHVDAAHVEIVWKAE
ncbi:MAG: hypothetical protein HUU46_08670 [Candidatus Hydrogenedentes bacterium]|nr:hypothetical protein [Candidatus Hydrogenedentota bacterium]